ncbi:MAG TPA: serine hydrolase domain-containing protein [Gemmatimonadaceae bacterium]|nr:serine hydrolase domain-containing protein [Gemmatimonadaceae bacterium]
MQKYSLAVVVSLALGASAAYGQRPATRRVAAATDSIVTTMMKTRHVPGASVLLAYGDTPFLAKGYGVADLDDDAPATPQTVYNIGSITKQFTAAAILQLVNAGKLKLDDTVNSYLPDAPMLLQPVTVRQLLTHTSGLRPPGALGDRWWSRRDYTREEWLRALADYYRGKQPLFAPGTAWSYGNVNYMALSLLQEKLSGRNYWDDVVQRFAAPLGMSSTAVCDPRVVQKHRARGYLVDDSTAKVFPAPYVTPTVSLGNAGLCSSVLDLFTWQRALVKHRVLDSATYALMATPPSLDGAPLDYALGLMAFPIGSQTMSFHTGGVLGFTGFLGYLPAQDATIVILTNANSDPLRIGVELARAVAGVPQPTTQSMSAAQMARYAGTYESEGVKAIVRPKQDELEAEVIGTGTVRFSFPVRLMKQNDSTFVVGWESQSRFVFHLGASTADSATLSFGTRTIHMKRD